jgi:hypothetical protein
MIASSTTNFIIEAEDKIRGDSGGIVEIFGRVSMER